MRKAFLNSSMQFLLASGSVFLSIYFAVFFPKILLLLLGVIFGYIVFRKHVWILVVTAIPALALGDIVTISLGERMSYSSSPGEFLLFFAFVFFCLNRIILNDTSPNRIRFGIIFAFLLTYILVAIALYQTIAVTHWYFAETKIVLVSLLAYFLARNVIDTGTKIRWLYRAIGLFAFLLAGQVFWYVSTHGLTADFLYDRNRVVLPIGAAAFASALLAFLMPITYFYSRYVRGGIEKMLFLALSIAGTMALFLLMSKAAIGSFLLGILFIALQLKQGRGKLLTAIGIFLLFLVILFLPYASLFFERILSAATDASNQYRLEEYRIIWGAAKDSLLFGLGPGQHIVYYQRFIYPDFINLLNNYFLQAFADLGLVGVTIVSGLVISLMNLSRKVLHNLSGERGLLGIGIIGAFVVAAINGMAEVTFFGLPYAIMFWTVAGATENIARFSNHSDHI